jgi:deazaflavin-dependent oxidoreductase (nitroreductase family)
MSTSPADYNAKVIEEFRANEGRVGGPFDGMDMLLLHHTGARSGIERINPLAYRQDGERYVVFASKAGAPEDPAWFHNLVANPQARIEVGTDEFAVLAEEAHGEERDRLYREQSEDRPQFREYEQKTDRVIPVVLLTPER